ncbi:unnamed protein product [Parajaminaea phylloscopi]
MASSSVYYKFKSQREPSRVVFDGTAISVWDLKREIILQNKMGKGIDFDLGLYSADTEEEFKDDNFSIPRSSTVIVRRLPPIKPGRGTAQMYVADLHGEGGFGGGEGASRFGPSASGVLPSARGGEQDRNRGGPSYRGPMSVRFDDRGRDSQSQSAPPQPAPVLPDSVTGQNADEAAGIAAMFQATTDQWDATQQQMANATYRARGGGPAGRGGGRGGGPFQARGGGPGGGGDHHQYSDRPPPVGYICYRCGQKGHWIQDCPTNKDPEWDNKPRFKRTTGIPKSMLKTVQAPTDEQRQAGVMITADGTYVVAQVDNATWERERNQGVKALSKSDVYQSVPSDSSLACPLCSKLLRSAVLTPCCSTKYCEECIQTHLLEHDFHCAECEKRIADLGNLKRDDETRKRVETYVQEAVERSESEIREREEKEEADAKAKAEQEEEQGQGQEHGKEQAAAGNGNEAGGDASKADGADAEASSGGVQNEGGKTSQNLSMPSNVPMVAFNPQLVQQLVMTLSNPQLPPPMRMMLQTQLQAQQMAFMRMQQQGAQPQHAQHQMANGHAMGGAPGMAMHLNGGMGGNPMMMNMMGGGPNGGPMGPSWNQGPMQQQAQQWRPPPMGMSAPMGMGARAGGFNGNGQMGGQNGGMPYGGYGRQAGRSQMGGGGMKRERDADFVELGGGGNKSVRMG